ncbi:MAG TPA: hydantoinase/oxoprolinase family protein [Thermomicrobiales bacterium]
MNAPPSVSPPVGGAGGADSHYRVGADIGGTFTDVVLVAPNGAFATRKVLSTVDDYSRGILDALADLLAALDVPAAAVAEIVHGTTVATNAILEGKGAPTALLTTRGFRDVLELRRLRTPHLYDRFYEPPRPIVERRLRLEVGERLDAAGEIVEPLDAGSVHVALDRIAGDGAEAVAICLLHSYRNPAHERRVGELVRARLPHVYLSLSVDVLPEIREYERTSTTVINAYVGPVVKSYLDSLAHRLGTAGIPADLLIMQSNGGIMSAAAAARTPAQIVESGPAAGVIAAHELGQQAGLPNLISFDMGGTTAKASIIEDGRLARTTEYEVGAGISLSSRLVKGGGHALKLPVLDIAEVGAGGGSIVWIDRGGALKVGPRSAGAMPGPVCHDTGGTEPTITDANVVLGYVNPRGLAGGAVRLRPELAEAALCEAVARPLGLDLAEAAFGVHTVANVTMIRAIKAVSTYRGRDPRDFTLLAFGGSGPIHAVGIARELGMQRVVVPPAPGLFSAGGLLAARQERHEVQTLFGRTEAIDLATVNATFCRLEEHARRELNAGSTQGAELTCRRSADLRYVGQGYELTVAAPAGTIDATAMADLIEAFGVEHERTYGHRATDAPVELVNLRVTARYEQDRARPLAPMEDRHRPARDLRHAYFGAAHGYLETPVIARFDLDHRPQPGPAIVEEYDATTVIPPGCRMHLDESNNVVIAV